MPFDLYKDPRASVVDCLSYRHNWNETHKLPYRPNCQGHEVTVTQVWQQLIQMVDVLQVKKLIIKGDEDEAQRIRNWLKMTQQQPWTESPPRRTADNVLVQATGQSTWIVPTRKASKELIRRIAEAICKSN